MAEISLIVNGQPAKAQVAPRTLLSDLLRDHLGLTGTHVGCEHGYCGACTVLVDGASARSCLMLAIQAHERQVDTVESLAHNGALHPIQQAFKDCHGLQCGFCTPGLLMSVVELAATNPGCSRDEIREHLSGNVCRCTGYHHIVDAVEAALTRVEAQSDDS